MKKWDTRMLVTAALLVAIQVVFSRFLSYNVWNMKIGLGFAPIALAGMLFGPGLAAVVGGVSDLLGALLFPSGPFFPGFTLTAVLAGGLHGLLLRRGRGMGRMVCAALLNQWVLGFLLNSVWISMMSGAVYGGLLAARWPQCALLTGVEIALLPVLARLAGRMERGEGA